MAWSAQLQSSLEAIVLRCSFQVDSRRISTRLGSHEAIFKTLGRWTEGGGMVDSNVRGRACWPPSPPYSSGDLAHSRQVGSLQNPAARLSQTNSARISGRGPQASACFKALHTTTRGLSLVQPGLTFSPSLAEDQGGFSQELKEHET